MGTLLLAITALLPAQTAAWITHTSAAGRYSISLPAQPRETTGPLESQGHTFEQHSAEVGVPGAVYMVVWTDPPIADTDAERREFVASARKALIDTIRGTQLTSAPYDFGQQGLEFTVSMAHTSGERIVRVRIFFLGTRAYTLVSMYPANAVRAADDRRFFDSFRIVSQ